MTMPQNWKRNSYIRILIASVASIILLVSIMIGYTARENRYVLRQTSVTLADTTVDIANTINTVLGYAVNSIQVTAAGISNRMTADPFADPTGSIHTFISNTPFTSIEYIRADGVNLTHAGNPFDARDREYYIRGMAGETGIWVNFSPKYSDEPLLNIFTPLYFNGEIIGVITGIMGGNTKIEPLLLSTFDGARVAGLLIDEENRIIASTVSFPKGMILTEETAEVEEEDKTRFIQEIALARGSSFELGGEYGPTLVAVSAVPSIDWKVIQIIPSKSLAEVRKEGIVAGYVALGALLTVSLLLFLLIVLEMRKMSQVRVDKANFERDEQMKILGAFSNVYNTMRIIDLHADSITAYALDENGEVFLNYEDNATELFYDSAVQFICEEQKDAAIDFQDLTTIHSRMKGKKSTYSDFKTKSQGWVRLSFVTIESDANDVPTKLMFTVQGIDEEKKKEQALIYNSITDNVTGLNNRKSYENDIDEYENRPMEKHFVYVSMDVNELNMTNDNYGHAAGDELIRGAASCMRKCMGNYGKVYRIGGDEFAALIFATPKRLEMIKQDFVRTLNDWKGQFVERISVSAGYTSRSEFPEKSIRELVEVAEQRLHEDKVAYYEKKGIKIE